MSQAGSTYVGAGDGTLAETGQHLQEACPLCLASLACFRHMQLLLEEELQDVPLSCDLGLFPPRDPEHLPPPLHLHASLTLQEHLCLDHAL